MRNANILLNPVFYSLIFVGIVSNCLSQNLVPNPSFETYTYCPDFYNLGEPLPCTPWQNVPIGTSDYFNACSNPSIVGVPTNWIGYQEAHTGQAYTGCHWGNEYLQVQLLCPLVEDLLYNISFYISLAELYCGTANIGVYFSSVPPPPPPNPPYDLDVIPQFESNLGYVSDYINWVQISGTFIAEGGEEWITIGNFYPMSETPTDPNCSIFPVSYYYVDDVSLTPSIPYEGLELELGDQVNACVSYEIDPGVTGVEYYWEDGSTETTLTVTESGTYSLTVTTSNCEIGIDSLEVTIVEVPAPFSLGDDTYICPGGQIVYDFDPGLGNFLWQDNSSSSYYLITEEGSYSLTISNMCGQAEDSIEITLLEPPEFSLGPDTYICPGAQIEYDFDPTLGNFLWQDNSSSSYYSITEPGTYALTISNICGQTEDNIEITLIQPPEFTLGPGDQALCEGQVIYLEFDPLLGDFLWQDGSDLNFYSISTAGHYSLTVTNECESISQGIDVYVLPQPVFDLGADTTLCPGQLPILLNIGNIAGAETYLWQDGSVGTQYEVISAGTYSITVSNDCFSVTDTIQITIADDSPLVQLPADQILCPGQILTLNGDSISGNYLWQDGSTNTEFIVVAPGVYSLTITNDCGSASDSITVDYIDPLTPPDLGPDVSLCPDEEYIFYTSITGVTYTWQDLSSADSLLVTTPGTYSLVISDGCTTATDTVVVTVHSNLPSIDLPASVSLCHAETITLESGIAGVQYLWNDGSELSSLTVSTPGTYSLTVTNSCGADMDTIIVLDGGPAPMVSLGDDIAICPGETILLTPPSSDVLSWVWQDGSTSSSFNVIGPGLIAVQVANDCGVNEDTMMVSLLPDIPPLNLGADTSLCPGELLTLNINIPDVSILWSDGSFTNDLDISTPGLFYATITNECGSTSDSVVISQLPPAPSLHLGIDQSLCPGETITISPGITDVNYVWQDGSTGSTFVATQAIDVILTISNDCGFATDTLVIVENTDGPQVSLGADVLACNGDIITLSSDISGIDYLWQDGSTSPDFSTDTSGSFILYVSNACGSDADTVIVDISGAVPAPDLGSNTVLCTGFSLELISLADASTSIAWQDGSSLPVYMVSAPGIYILTESNHCGDASDTLMVTYETPPELFDLGPDTILCPGESIILMAPDTSALITWQDGNHANYITADQEQTYSLELSNLCGIVSDDLSVSIDSRIPVINIGQEIPLCKYEIITLDATQTFDAGYLWSTGSALPSIHVLTPGLYDVYVTTPCHSLRQEVEVIPGEDCNHDVYIPSIFSPNNDDLNDVFTISIGSKLDVVAINCSVYDRWGNLVFNSHEINFSWDGRFQNSDLMAGVYVYLISLDYNAQGEVRSQVFTGDITLIR